MASYTVEIVDSDDVSIAVRDNPQALNTARAVAIAIARIRMGEPETTRVQGARGPRHRGTARVAVSAEAPKHSRNPGHAGAGFRRQEAQNMKNFDPSTLIILSGPDADTSIQVLEFDLELRRIAAARELASERGVACDADSLPLVVYRGAYEDARLDADPSVVTYENVPADSPALSRFLAAVYEGYEGEHGPMAVGP